MKNSLVRFLLPASALACLASFALPTLRADEPMVGALTDSSSPAVTAPANDAGSPVVQADTNKKGKKKKGKKKGKKAKAAATSADQAAVSAAPAADAAR
jgi:hypothetical protein